MAASNNDNFPTTPVSNNARSFFEMVLSPNARRADSLVLLAGPVAAHMQQQSDPQIAFLYLQAVARHVVPPAAENNNATENTRLINEIVQAVAFAASKCVPRLSISQSGILPALVQLVACSPGVLTNIHPELLQVALLAGQYRYIRDTLHNHWPRPSHKMSILKVLRYYYYRGMVHMGCEEWNLAVRCFWTCLSVPSNVVSAVSIAAWKKMVLVQCLRQAALEKSDASSILNLPAAASPAVVRFFSVQAAATKKTETSETPTATTTVGGSPSAEVQQSSSKHGVAEYFDLIHAFWHVDRSIFDQAKFLELWRLDGNAGMVNRVAVAFQHRQVYQLARIYSVLPLSQLSTELQLSTNQVQALLLQLSSKGDMDIQYLQDGEDIMVSFAHNRTNQQVVAQESVEEIMALAEKVRQLDVAIATTPRYQHLARGRDNVMAHRGPRGVADI